MKHTLLITLEYPPTVGGVAEYLAKFVEGLPSGSVSVLAPAGPETHESDMHSKVPIFRRRLIWRWFRPSWLPALYWTDWFCRQEGKPAAIIVSHLLPMGKLAWWMKVRRRIPYSVIVHGMDVALALSGSKRKRAEAGRILRGAAVVAANSEFTANLLAAFRVPPERIVIMRPSPSFATDVSVPDERVRELRREHGLEGGLVLLSAGRLVARKGFDLVIKAVARLQQQGLEVRQLVVGDGPERARLEKLAADAGLEDRITFLGQVERERLPELFAAADVFVMTPRSIGPDLEGFGIVYLEANLLGKPTVGSRTGGVPEAVLDGETGLLVDPNDLDGLVAVLRRLHDDPDLRQRLGRRGRQRVLEQFGRGRQATAYAQALAEATGAELQRRL